MELPLALTSAEKRAVRAAANWWFRCATADGMEGCELPRGLLTARRALARDVLAGTALPSEAVEWLTTLLAFEPEDSEPVKTARGKYAART